MAERRQCFFNQSDQASIAVDENFRWHVSFYRVSWWTFWAHLHKEFYWSKSLYKLHRPTESWNFVTIESFLHCLRNLKNCGMLKIRLTMAPKISHQTFMQFSYIIHYIYISILILQSCGRVWRGYFKVNFVIKFGFKETAKYENFLNT